VQVLVPHEPALSIFYAIDASKTKFWFPKRN
jgi:hypothetical protein